MNTEKKACIFDKYEEGVIVALSYGHKLHFATTDKFRIGQVVWVCYDFTTNSLTSVRHTPMRERVAPNIIPEPPTGHPYEEETIPEVEAAEEWTYTPEEGEEEWPYE